MPLTLVTAPASPVISLAEAKTHMRLVDSGSPPSHPDDTDITAYVQGVIDQIDGPQGWLGRSLVTQTWDYKLDSFPPSGRGIKIPLPPLQSITTFQYLDTDNVMQTLTGYTLDSDSAPAFIAPPDTGWPATYDTLNAVAIRFVCGYGAAAAVPEVIRNYVRVMAAQSYNRRDPIVVGASVAELRFVDRSLDNYRIWDQHD